MQGIQGLQGFQGIQGVQGLQGFQGFQGVQGMQGFQGFQGIQGVQGIQGIQGMQGVQGMQGFQGVQGLQGIQGVQGVQGMQGVQGFQGMQGIQGLAGAGALNAAFADAGSYISDQMLNTLDGALGGGFKSQVQPTVDAFARAQIAFVSDTTLQKVCNHPAMYPLCNDLFAYLTVINSNPGFVGILAWHTLNINALEVFLAQGWQLGLRDAALSEFGQTLLHYYALAMWRTGDRYDSYTVPGKTAPVGGWFNDISELPPQGGSATAYAQFRDVLVTSFIEMTNIQGAEENYQDVYRARDDCSAAIPSVFKAYEPSYNCTMNGLGQYGIVCASYAEWGQDPEGVFTSRLGQTLAQALFGWAYYMRPWMVGCDGDTCPFTDACGNARTGLPGIPTTDGTFAMGAAFNYQNATFYARAWHRQRVSCAAWLARTGTTHPDCQ
jgi:hypothetical protein